MCPMVKFSDQRYQHSPGEKRVFFLQSDQKYLSGMHQVLPQQKSPWVHHEAVAERLAVLSIQTEPLEQLEGSCLAHTGRSLAQLRKATLQWQQDGPEERELQQQEGEEQRFALTWSGQLSVSH